ncbi:MAG: DUF928 domain-containing protein [Coleofasciculus sp. G3-WIS-01]|uniref:DUF928 domain-containing protein n=1 Tax=Coleofasciculus sp. G3-WIS-01 TaxID=3069528 RepID=UPI0032F148F3
MSSVLVSSLGYSLKFPPTDGTGAPERTASGGRRDLSCLQADSMSLTALVPRNNLVTTVSETPSLFFDIPQTRAKTAELVLMDNQGNELAQKMIPLTGEAGVMDVKLPATAKLEMNQIYRWELAIICNSQDRTQDVFIQGKLQRRELPAELVRQLETSDLPQQAQLYAEAGIWHESLAIALRLRDTYPNALAGLLQSVGL